MDGQGFDSLFAWRGPYTAGPDEEIDTAFNQPGGWLTGDDDSTVLAHAGSDR